MTLYDSIFTFLECNLSSTVDARTRLLALALANDCYKYKMDLVTNGVVITDVIEFVQQKKEELSKVNGFASNNEDKMSRSEHEKINKKPQTR